MGIYILIGILYILLFGAFYIGFKEFNSFKENYYKDKNFSFTKFQNLEDFYNKTESQTQNISNLVESYKVVHNWYLRPSTLWLMPKAEYTNNKLVRNCLTNRGHSVIN